LKHKEPMMIAIAKKKKWYGRLPSMWW
jgi:hypothetical protein